MNRLIFIALIFCLAVQSKDPLSLCSSKTQFNFDWISFNPPAPVVGQDLTVKAAGFLNVPVSPGSQFRLVLKFGPIKVFDKVDYVCSPLSKTDCWTPGQLYDLEAIFPIPDNVPLVILNLLI